MNVTQYSVEYEEELRGALELTVEHDGEEHVLEFEFGEYSNPPHVHSPFPSPEKEIYAWPSEEIPDELQFEQGSDEAMLLSLGGISGLPEGINLMSKPYNEVDDSAESPFVKFG